MRFISCFGLLAISISGTVLAQSTDTNFAIGPEYLMTTGSPLFSQPLATPTLSLPNPALQVGAANTTADLAPGADTQPVSPQPPTSPNLYSVYYGSAPAILNETNPSELPEESSLSELPAHIFNEGVWGENTIHAPREAGKVAFLTQHSTHVYTNADIDRLRQSDAQKKPSL
jgi:hypothetical protein